MSETALAHDGPIAILCGLRPGETEALGQALYVGGTRLIEVPPNSPGPLHRTPVWSDGCLARIFIQARRTAAG